MSDSEDPLADLPEIDEGGDDLFGDDDDAIPDNVLSEGDFASDKEDENDRAQQQTQEDGDEPREFREKLAAEVPLYRHRIPRSKDGDLKVLRVPKFLKINPLEYKADEWQPSQWELDNANSATPIPAVMFRRHPTTGKLQSNANIFQWSDGSTTLSIGGEHYTIHSKAMATPQGKPYQEVKDSHLYAAAAHLTTNSLLIVGHVTEQYVVDPNEQVMDHALERLMAEMGGAKKTTGQDMLIATTEDPELQKKQAELAEKERAKLQRRRETAAARSEGAGGRGYKGALSIGDLEGRRGAGGGRKRGAPGTGKKKNRRPEYDSDDELPGGVRRADNYDMEDGFLVDSDEEDEGMDDDEEEEELLDDDEEEDERPRVKRQRTADPDDDAEGEDDDGAPATSHRRRHKRVVEDEDED
ncbi:hypothetical protein QBC35DRAFT_287368 [Podospora australis]|uniref:RNA polymerase-associated protein LEO1 n=1 Tax=Podospora australis TaxID=1536484 RepID=A0AAN6WTE7_9PEZI|nr:hypothetical protein QBC35DRAFT_287368 [Podospora australis]